MNLFEFQPNKSVCWKC